MIGGIFSGLFSAWILKALFGFDTIVINSLNELFSITISLDTYYFIFAIAFGIGGWLTNLIQSLQRRKSYSKDSSYRVKHSNNYNTTSDSTTSNANTAVDVDYIDLSK